MGLGEIHHRLLYLIKTWARYFSYWLFMLFQELFFYASFLSAIPKNNSDTLHECIYTYLFSTQDIYSYFLCICVSIPYKHTIHTCMSAQSWYCISSLIAFLFAYWSRTSHWTKNSLILESLGGLLIHGISLVFQELGLQLVTTPAWFLCRFWGILTLVWQVLYSLSHLSSCFNLI